MSAVPAVRASSTEADSIALQGRVRYEAFGYPDADSATPSEENFFDAALTGGGRLGLQVNYQFEARVVADDVEFTAGGYSLRNATRRRPYLALVTAAVDYRPVEPLRLSVGKQIVHWSIFDEMQPANLLCPRDESDIFRRVELGVDGVAAHYQMGRAFAELVAVPLAFTPARLPQGRWRIIPTAIEQRQELPPVRFDETQAGARLGFRSGQLNGSVIGYVGRDSEAIFVPRLIFVGGEEVFRLQIIDRYPRLRAGGVTASYPLGAATLARLESVYYNSPDRDRDDFLHTAVGMEYGRRNWRLLLNYLRDDQTARAPEQVTDEGERRFFQSFVFGEVRYEGGGRLLGRVRGGYDLTGEFLILQPEISYRVWRGLTVALAGDLIDANRPSYFERVQHEDRLGTWFEYRL
jgi:hypothetical protein